MKFICPKHSLPEQHAEAHRKNTVRSTPSMAYAPMPQRKSLSANKAPSPPCRNASTMAPRSNNSAIAA